MTRPSTDAPPTRPIEVFYSYSHKDEGLRDELETHLSILRRRGVISNWHDRRISGGLEWADQISEHLNKADLILLLVSADFLASDYCYDKEVLRAMARHQLREARVIPVILRDCDWDFTSFSKLQALPRDGRHSRTSRSGSGRRQKSWDDPLPTPGGSAKQCRMNGLDHS
jgi:hypothetical protein